MPLNKHAIQGIKLTNNFWLKEFIEGSVMPSEATRMVYENIEEHKLARIGVIAYVLQDLRDRCVKKFGSSFKGINILCGVRVKKWELLQGRSGNSQHTEYWAADVTPICDAEDFDEIFEFMFEEMLGFAGGVAINRNNKFIHIDCRGYVARWDY